MPATPARMYLFMISPGCGEVGHLCANCSPDHEVKIITF
jgi:hypothetical protein